jgi:hypothetical protein
MVGLVVDGEELSVLFMPLVADFINNLDMFLMNLFLYVFLLWSPIDQIPI